MDKLKESTIIARILLIYVNEYHSDWDEYLTFVTFAYNTTEQSTTKFSPFRILIGTALHLPQETHLPLMQIDRETWIEHQWPKMKEILKNNLQEARQRYANNYNENCVP